MTNLFLSYSRKDKLLAARFTKWLKRHGHDVWTDDHGISGGASFSVEIESALEQCCAVLVLWSANSVQSAWVKDEAGYGRDAGKLIPFSLDGTEPPLGFRQFQAIDLSGWKARRRPPAADRIEQAIERLAAGLKQSTPAVEGAVKKRPRSRSVLRRAAAAVVLAALIVLAGVTRLTPRASDNDITIAVTAARLRPTLPPQPIMPTLLLRT